MKRPPYFAVVGFVLTWRDWLAFTLAANVYKKLELLANAKRQILRHNAYPRGNMSSEILK